MSSRDPELTQGVEPVPDRAAPSHRDLDKSVLSGLAWTGGMRSVTQTVQWAAALVVVRLLSPADYGLVAMGTSYLGLVEMFTEFGMGAAIVQRRNLSSSQISRLGGVSLLLSTLMAFVTVLLSGYVAAFFHEPRVRLVVIALSATSVFTGVDILARSLMQRDLQFQRLAWVEASKSLTYAAASLVLAAVGLGYWALVFAAVISAFVRMVAALAARWHPMSWPRDLATIRSELWFGWHVLAARLTRYVRKFSDILIVSRLFGTEAVGVYNVGWTQANIPVDRGTSLITQVAPSVLAAVQDDPPALRRYIRLFTEAIALLSFPATLGLAVIADDFVMLVFGERWVATIGPLRVLAIVAAMRAVTPILTQVLVATDQAKKSMHFGIAAALMMPVFLFVGSYWGVTGVAMGWLVGHPIVVATVLLPPALRAADMALTEYFRALRPAVLASLAMVGLVTVLRLFMPTEWPLAGRLALEISVGAVGYGLAILPLYRGRLQYLLSLLRTVRRGPPAVAG